MSSESGTSDQNKIRPESDEFLRPSQIMAMEDGRGKAWSVKRYIFCDMWLVTETDEIHLATKKVKFGQDTFKYKGKEYTVLFSHKQWRKQGLTGRRLTLNYGIGNTVPLSFRSPTKAIDASLVKEVHRRKALLSLLNKADFMLMIMVIGMMVVAGALGALALFKDQDNRKQASQISTLQAENSALKAQLGIDLGLPQNPVKK